MARKRVVLVVACIAALAGTRSAFAQEVGARRVEINSALFAGGTVVFPKTDAGDRLRAFVINAAVTANLNALVGLEGDIGVALGRHAALDLYGVAASTRGTPTILMYTGSVIVNPIRSDRRFVPFLQAGAGGWRTFAESETTAVRLTPSTDYLTVMVGGGVRWFPIPYWGLRADYRYHSLFKGDRTAFGDGDGRRAAHQVYVGLIVTF